MRRVFTAGAVALGAVVAVILALASPGTAAPQPPVTNYQVVTVTFEAVDVNHVAVDATCPAGKRVLGGGGTITAYGAFTNPGAFQLVGSAPIGGQTGWRAEWHDPGSQASITVAVTALCANTT